MDEVAASERGFGTVDGFHLAVTHAQAQAAADDFFAERLVNFGAYEDAMSADEGLLYHSMLAAYLNIGLLEPMDLIRRAEDAYRSGKAPINSVEGFIRQILGWREYIYLHDRLQMPGLLSANGWEHKRTLPQMFWHGETEMNCLHTVIGQSRAGGLFAPYRATDGSLQLLHVGRHRSGRRKPLVSLRLR